MNPDEKTSAPLWQAELPFAWQSGRPVRRSARETGALLQILHDYDQPAEPDAAQGLLQAKLDVLLLWLAQSQRNEPLTPCALEFAVGELSWIQADALVVGAEGVVICELSAALPAQFEFAARITACLALADGRSRVTARLIFSDEEQDEAFARFLFGRHRQCLRQHKQEQAC
ncbi:hypothetical protein [Chitinilyticum piscinae]|uniref:Cyclic di-GMP receptor atypical PilZ domain-containing protein n=1 Tax=Chitinilyticum piscinae TaxID=2866724 RepID=A0A8J7G149_9NEIS|nr:hypothetical protein [Chitinilyticum piscinae]MBE9609488.1 hypothetical protein [Chitinilyticum piscinae]